MIDASQVEPAGMNGSMHESELGVTVAQAFSPGEPSNYLQSRTHGGHHGRAVGS